MVFFNYKGDTINQTQKGVYNAYDQSDPKPFFIKFKSVHFKLFNYWLLIIFRLFYQLLRFNFVYDGINHTKR